MSDNDIIIYTTEDGLSQFTLRELGTQLWLSQLEIAELYQTTKQNISKHIKAIFDEREFDENSTVNFQLTVQNEGGREIKRQIAYYPLPLILAIGYRVLEYDKFNQQRRLEKEGEIYIEQLLKLKK